MRTRVREIHNGHDRKIRTNMPGRARATYDGRHPPQFVRHSGPPIRQTKHGSVNASGKTPTRQDTVGFRRWRFRYRSSDVILGPPLSHLGTRHSPKVPCRATGTDGAPPTVDDNDENDAVFHGDVVRYIPDVVRRAVGVGTRGGCGYSPHGMSHTQRYDNQNNDFLWAWFPWYILHVYILSLFFEIF